MAQVQKIVLSSSRDSVLANAFDARHPREPADLLDALIAFDGDSRQALFAHCVS